MRMKLTKATSVFRAVAFAAYPRWLDRMTGVIRALLIIVSIGSTVCVPAVGWAQPAEPARLTPEVSLILGLGHVYRWDDQVFGDRLNIGGSLAIMHRSGFALEFESDRTVGLPPDSRVRSATITSVVVRYQFRARRFQPYILAGVGVLWSKYLSSEATVVGGEVVRTDIEQNEAGLGPDLGGGLRVLVAGPISVNPEIRWLDASFRARANLGVTRFSIRAAYAW